MRPLILLCAMALASCASKAERAQEDYENLVADGGTPAQVCAAAQRVAETYAEKNQDGAASRRWQDRARAACLLTYSPE